MGESSQLHPLAEQFSHALDVDDSGEHSLLCRSDTISGTTVQSKTVFFQPLGILQQNRYKDDFGIARKLTFARS
jgi:hypothetical protein